MPVATAAAPKADRAGHGAAFLAGCQHCKGVLSRGKAAGLSVAYVRTPRTRVKVVELAAGHLGYLFEHVDCESCQLAIARTARLFFVAGVIILLRSPAMDVDKWGNMIQNCECQTACHRMSAFASCATIHLHERASTDHQLC